jgi:nucleoside phosphorylase
MADSNPTPQADVLVVTATEVEAQTVLDTFAPGVRPERHFVGDNTYFDLGVHGGARMLLVQSEMGASGPGGMQATVTAAIGALHPASIVMVGIAFGVNRKKQKIGDVLVSRQLMSYDLQRVGTDKDGKQTLIPRGERAHASVRLVDRFTAGKKDWHKAEVSIGLIVSGDKLVDNLEFRQQLLQFEPEAIGGEMEGAGLYSAAERARAHWILVKAICDWADGHKGRNKKQRQKLAAANAAQFVLHVISQGGFVSPKVWPPSNRGELRRPNLAPAARPRRPRS